MTYSYFETDEVVSAAQKSVRRGLPEAYQWFLELFFAGKAGRERIWGRAQVMAVEDIGPANPHLILHIRRLAREFKDSVSAICQACQHLIESPKSRVNDHAIHYLKSRDRFGEQIQQTSSGFNREIESLSRGQGRKVYPLKLLKDKLLEGLKERKTLLALSAAHAIHQQAGEDTRIWEILIAYRPCPYLLELRDVGRGNPFRSSDGVLLWVQAIHLIWSGGLPEMTPDLPPSPDFSLLVSRFRNRQSLDGTPLLGMPDFAIDMHTFRGKTLKRGSDHFMSVGAKLENEDQNWKPYSQWYLTQG